MYNVYPQRSLPTTPSSPRKCNSIAQSNFSGFNVCRIYRSSHPPASITKGMALSVFFFFTSSDVCVYERGRRALNGDGCGHCWVSLSLFIVFEIFSIDDIQWYFILLFYLTTIDRGSNLFIENIIRDVPRDNNDPWKLAARSGLEREVLLLVQSARRRGGP